MGKRVLLNFGVSFSPAWRNPNFFTNSDHWRKYYSFNYDLSPEIEVIAWKRGSAGAVYHWYETKFYHPEVIPNDIFDYTTIFNDSPIVDDLIVHGFGIYYKQYLGNRARAPIGTYFKFQFDGYFYTAPSVADIEKGQMFAFKTEFGHDFLVFDRLRVSTGFSFGIPFCKWWKNLNYGKSSFDFSDIFYNSNNSMYDFVNTRLAGHYYLGFYVSIGLLTF